MSAVQFHCPLCDGLFQVDDALSGIEVNCPHCQGLVMVPDFAGPPQPTSETLQLSCPVCTGPFQVTAEMSGQQVTCPHCQQVVAVPELDGFPTGYSPPPEPMLPPTAAAAVDVNAFYPPGYQAPATRTEPEHPREESLLPPSAGGGTVRTASPSDLLPPGAADTTAAVSERKPLPAAIPERSAKDPVLIPTDKGYVGVHEPVKTIRRHGEEVELRKLTPEEKARRRVVRNTILFLFCVVTLIVVMALFMWK